MNAEVNSKKIRKFAAMAIAILVLIYVGYQVYTIRHKEITTETAMYASVSDTLQTKGFAVRKESVIHEAYSGILSYHVADGVRVSKGEAIADIYASESDAAAQNQLASIDREIENLSLLTGPSDYYASNPSVIGTQIYTALGEILVEARQNDFSKIASLKEELQTALNRKQLLTGDESGEDYEQRIAALQSQRDSLVASAGDKVDVISADTAGYSVSSLDGFENAVDIDQVKKLTVTEIRTLQEKQENVTSEKKTDAIGKICSDFNWYLACVFSESDMVKLEGITNVYLEIPFASTEQIPATIAASNKDKSTGETAVIFECSYMDPGIALLRNESIQIDVKTYSGVLVRKEALRFRDVAYTLYDEDGEVVLDDAGNPVTKIEKDVMGVFVKYGSTLKFVQVFSDKTVNGYAICKTELSEEDRDRLVTDSTIQLYDEVVTEGTDLYDGKLVR